MDAITFWPWNAREKLPPSSVFLCKYMPDSFRWKMRGLAHPPRPAGGASGVPGHHYRLPCLVVTWHVWEQWDADAGRVQDMLLPPLNPRAGTYVCKAPFERSE